MSKKIRNPEQLRQIINRIDDYAHDRVHHIAVWTLKSAVDHLKEYQKSAFDPTKNKIIAELSHKLVDIKRRNERVEKNKKQWQNRCLETEKANRNQKICLKNLQEENIELYSKIMNESKKQWEKTDPKKYELDPDDI